MAIYHFPSGHMVSVASIGDSGQGIDAALSAAVSIDITVKDKATDAVLQPISPTSGNPMQLKTNDRGQFPAFNLVEADGVGRSVVRLEAGETLSGFWASVEAMDGADAAKAALEATRSLKGQVQALIDNQELKTVVAKLGGGQNPVLAVPAGTSVPASVPDGTIIIVAEGI